MSRVLSRASVRRALLAASLAAVPLLVPVGGALPIALASARYVSSNPEAGGFVTTAPANVKVTFTEGVTAEGSNISVIALGGVEVNAGPVAVDPGDAKTLVVPLKSGLPNGLYTVNWVAVTGATGARETSSFNFGLRAGAAPPTMSMDHPVADLGQVLSVSGSGYKPNGSIVVSVGDDDEFVDAGKADSAGHVSLGIHLPADLPYGKQTITVADGDGAKAVGDVQVKWGGWPPVKASVTADTAKDDMTFTVSVSNRSDYTLRLEAVRVHLPEGTSYKSSYNNGRLDSVGEVTWDAIALAPHGSVGPLTLVVDTTKLKDGTDVSANAWVYYSHAEEKAADGIVLPQFVSSALSKPTGARSGGLH